MKKRFISMLLVASCFGVANAQVVVDDDGHVAVGIETADPVNSILGVNTTGSTSSAVYVSPETDHENGIHVQKSGRYPASSSTLLTAYSANTTVCTTHQSCGLYARTYSTTPTNSGRAYGVCAFAGNSTSGWNYGVCGSLLGTQNGAGIYGTSVRENKGVEIGGRYAGYFYGPVYVTSTLTANEIVTLSDYRVKENVKSLNNSSSLDNIMNMNVVEYNYDSNLMTPINDGSDTATVAVCTSQIEVEKILPKQKHFGLIAQELQQIYPDLVKESQEGYLTINYLEIIPLLISSVQELNAKIEQYENGGSPIKKTASREATDLDAVVNTLYQNEPNPFTVSTVIRCDVAEEVAKADLYIYNMNGEQIAEYAVTERGETSVTIDGGSLNAGMYLYALVTDGKVIDTKRMILTK